MSFQSDTIIHQFFETPHGGALPGGKAILLCVHGRGGKKELMEWLPKRFKVPGLDFMSLQAPHPENVPQMKAPGFSWYYKEASKGLDESREKISSLVEELFRAGYAYDKIFWIGFSQGGVMGLDYALRTNRVLGGLICVSGFVLHVEEYPEAFGSAAKNQRLIATHGRRDEIVDFDKATATYDKIVQAGVPLQFREFSKGHSFDLKEEIPFLIESLKAWTTA